MNVGSRITLFIAVALALGLVGWALFSPKPDLSLKINQTLKEQAQRADLAFKDVTFEEVAAGIKYWQLNAKSAMVNKSTNVAALKDARGTFFKKGVAVLNFRSPAAIWDMNGKEIMLDQPIGYDIKLEEKINRLLNTSKKLPASMFYLPQLYRDGLGYWFQAKNLSWKLANQNLICSGGIILNKGEVTGFAEKLQGDVALEKIRIEGSPRIVITPQKNSAITLEAEVFEVISSEDVITAQGNPKIRWGEAVISSDKIRYRQKDKTLELAGQVKIDYGDINASGLSAIYPTEASKIILLGKAKASQGENKLSGDRVEILLNDKKISVLGKGKVIISEEDIK